MMTFVLTSVFGETVKLLMRISLNMQLISEGFFKCTEWQKTLQGSSGRVL